jgi:hypothetical protein
MPDPLRRPFALGAALALLIGACAPTVAPIPAPAPESGVAIAPAPADIIGFDPGEDYKLADYGQLLEYYRALAAASDRVELVEIGRTTRDRPMVLLVISSAENLAQLERWRDISARLGRAEGLTDDGGAGAGGDGKAIVWIDAGLHSTEVATSQHAPHLAYHLATDESEETRRVREDVVLLLMPVMNPDGHEIVVDWYRSSWGRSTRPPAAGGLPRVRGHDINRDWYMFRQQETRVVGRICTRTGFPQIVFNHHQTAPFPARIFIPPFADPVNPHIDPRVVRGVNLVGEHMAHRFEMENAGRGVRMTFTMWWNGGMRTAPYFHNQIGILSEVGHASPTPRDHDPATSRRRSGRGIPTLEPTVRYPNPWRGGRASLGQAVRTTWWRRWVRWTWRRRTGRTSSTLSTRWGATPSTRRGGRSVRVRGLAGGPARPGRGGGDAEHAAAGGIEVERATAAFQAGGRAYPAGATCCGRAQAFRAHLLDLMEPQEHPHREMYPGGPPEPPYGGLAGYTLPIQMGVTVARVDEPFRWRPNGSTGYPRPGAGHGQRGRVPAVARENRTSTALRRLLADGARVRRALVSFGVDGERMMAGTLVVEGAASGVEALVRELGLTARRTVAAPEVPLAAVRASRIGIYRPWTGNMDEGWTRWLLDHYGLPYRTLTNAEIRGGGLADVDVVLFASQSAQSILRGHPEGRMPEPYTGGVGAEGVEALRRFVEGGAARRAGRRQRLPRSTTSTSPWGTPWPGSSARTSSSRVAGAHHVDGEHPVGFGMPAEAAAFFQDSRAFDVTASGAGGRGPLRLPRPPAEWVGRSVPRSIWPAARPWCASRTARATWC